MLLCVCIVVVVVGLFVCVCVFVWFVLLLFLCVFFMFKKSCRAFFGYTWFRKAKSSYYLLHVKFHLKGGIL